MDAAALVGTVAFVLSAIQLTQMGSAVLRSDDPSGVSVPMWLLLVTQGVAWVVFGTAERLWPSVGINALLVVVAASVLRRMLGSQPARLAATGVWVIAFTSFAVVTVAAGRIDAIGWVAGALVIVALIPQVAMLIRTRDTAGLSLVSWSVGLAALVCWLGYGLATGTAQVIVSTIPPLICNAVIVGALVRSRGGELDTVGA